MKLQPEFPAVFFATVKQFRILAATKRWLLNAFKPLSALRKLRYCALIELNALNGPNKKVTDDKYSQN